MLTEGSKKDILNSFLETIGWIADIEYQRRAWIHGEPPGTDFDETVNYFSESEWIIQEYKNFGITDGQYQILKKFRDEFRKFSDHNNLPQLFIDTAEWTEITQMAQKMLEAFNYGR